MERASERYVTFRFNIFYENSKMCTQKLQEIEISLVLKCDIVIDSIRRYCYLQMVSMFFQDKVNNIRHQQTWNMNVQKK